MADKRAGQGNWVALTKKAGGDRFFIFTVDPTWYETRIGPFKSAVAALKAAEILNGLNLVQREEAK